MIKLICCKRQLNVYFGHLTSLFFQPFEILQSVQYSYFRSIEGGEFFDLYIGASRFSYVYFLVQMRTDKNFL
ncbi:unnamed protein product [Acanthoscelides obtectus]|uniref:Uncharacterized protein n=1 Tax=Acanthoscelides obtectus TaxID=200917 RepID=A0A9P0K9L6_ACAOB|nr:unnamed protein product [Acanthoscelides obtectus]CAK1648300.1 hypothetical protein AOBTE_LOCUS15662 [Acanthoscelides obtectus]